MKYLLVAFGDEAKVSALSEAEMATLGEKCNAYDEELRQTGRVVATGSLGWRAKSMRLDGGKLRVTDGPFIESKELIGGFIILEADSDDEALRLAALHPAARMGEELGWGIELRPMEYCQLKAVAEKLR